MKVFDAQEMMKRYSKAAHVNPRQATSDLVLVGLALLAELVDLNRKVLPPQVLSVEGSVEEVAVSPEPVATAPQKAPKKSAGKAKKKPKPKKKASKGKK